NFKRIITVEEGAVPGGFGDAVLEFFHSHDNLVEPKIRVIGLPDEFVEHGPQALWREQFNLSAEGIVREVEKHFADLFETTDALTTKSRRD
ncbi:MAG: transketolase C-terminal domain-containing protein, partial [Chloroflexia bacterium]